VRQESSLERYEPPGRSRRRNAHIEWTKIGTIILIGGGVFCILVLSYFFYYYDLTHQRQFASWVAPIPYYYLPAALATLLLGSLCLDRSNRINLVILFVSLGGSIYVGELFLTVLDVHTAVTQPIWGNEFRERKYETKKLAKDFGVNFDTRSRLEVITDLRAKGIDAVPYMIPAQLLEKQEDGRLKSELNIHGTEVMPLGGISNKVTVFCNETGKYLIYNSDEHGFHNPKGIWKSDRVPVVAVGDSFTQGGCVSTDKGFVALIRNRYPGTLNLGMAGDGPLMMLAALKEYLPSVRPRIVLWFHFVDDIEDLREEEQSGLLMRYLGSDFNQNLLARQTDIDQALLDYLDRKMAKEVARQQEPNNMEIRTKLVEIVKLSTLRRKLGLVGGTSTVTKAGSSETKARMELFQTILSQAKATVSASGGTLYLDYLPPWEAYGNPQLANQTGSQYRDRVLSSVKALDIPIIDIDPAFHAQKDPLSLFSFRRSGHYNEEGHRLVATEVLRSIASQNSRETPVESGK